MSRGAKVAKGKKSSAGASAAKGKKTPEYESDASPPQVMILILHTNQGWEN